MIKSPKNALLKNKDQLKNSKGWIALFLVWLVVGQNAITFAMEQSPNSPLVKRLDMPGSPNHGRKMREVLDSEAIYEFVLKEMITEIAKQGLSEKKGQSALNPKRKSLPFGLKLSKNKDKVEDKGSAIRLSKEEFAKAESLDKQYNDNDLDARVERWITGVLNNPEFGQKIID